LKNKNLKKIEQLALESHGLEALESVSVPTAYWSAHFFHVNNSSYFTCLDLEQQKSFLVSMSTHILQEACGIEKAGLTYSARMNLMSKNLEEKVLYSLIGAEEALHLKSLEPFLSVSEREHIPFFANLISQWIHKLERPSLLVLIQILLEGWGLTYYNSLAQSSTNMALQSVLQKILQDESRHHAAGVVLFQNEILNPTERSLLENELITLFECVQIGPQQAALELALAGSDRNIDFQKLFIDMNAMNDTQAKLNKLKKLLDKSLDQDLIRSSLAKDLFKTYPIERMAVVADAQFSNIVKNRKPFPNLKSDISL